MLKDTKTAPDFKTEMLAQQTDGLSGSDLRELCRDAAMVPVREYMRSSATNQDMMAKGQLEVRPSEVSHESTNTKFEGQGFDIRPLRLEDFFAHDETSPLPPVTPEEMPLD